MSRLPGIHLDGGERPSWPRQHPVRVHHAVVSGDLADASWRDRRLTVHDVCDEARPGLLLRRTWCPPSRGGTHTALPLPGHDLLMVADEGIADDCADQPERTRVFRVRVPADPISDSTFPTPAGRDYCVEVAACLPPPARSFDTSPARPRGIQGCDASVDAAGVLHVTDYDASLFVQYEGS